MATTIDSLQVEIQTNSTNAAVGIRDLAKSLGELKANGTIGVATKNLKALSDALTTFKGAANVTSSIGKLSGAMERLKSIGSITGIANSIKKLNENLRGIDNINIDNIAPQLERVASALTPLSNVKAGGINTMMNGLKKLGEVTKSLDDDTIAAFIAKVKQLNEALEPLSQKMTTIQGGFRGINSAIRQTSVTVQQANAEVNVSVFNLSNMINVIQGVAQALNVVIQKLTEAISQAIEWDGIAARFGRGFGAQAEETYAWIQRLNEEMGINIQQFMQYSSVYATMLTGFGVAMEDAGKMALGYTELTYDIWAGYNDVYNGFADAAEAVKSAIAGEVEPIRRAGFTIVESTLEQTAANYGLNISLEKATEAEKSYLRYLTLVDQAHAQSLVGTYAKEMNTAEGIMRTFTQQLKSLVQSFGSLFIPILVKVMPYLQAVIDLLTEAVSWVAALFGIEIQAINWDGYGDGISSVTDSASDATDALDSATSAAESLKNATLGFDELNVISPSTSSSSDGSTGSSGSSGASFDVDSLWDASIFDDVQSKVKDIKEKIEEMLPTITAIGIAIAGLSLAKVLNDLDLTDTKFANLNSTIKGLSKGLAVASVSIAVGALVWDFTGAYLETGDWTEWLKTLGTTAIGTGLAYAFAGKGGAAFTLMVSGIVMLGRLAFDLSEGTVDFGDSETWITMITGGIETVIGTVISWKVLKPIVTSAIKTLMESGVMTSITSTIIPFLTANAPYLILAAVVVGYLVLAFVNYDFTALGQVIGEKIGSAIKAAIGWVADVGKAVLKGVKAALVWAKNALDIDDFWDVLAIIFVPGEVWKRISPDITKLFTKISNWINKKIENLQGNINEFVGGFFDGLFDSLDIDVTWAEKIAEFFDIEYTDIIEASMSPLTLGKHIITGINNGINSNAKLSALRDKVSAMWTNAKTWWDTKKTAMKSYVPSIGSIYEKVKERWDNARTWWNSKKTGMKQYTPNIGSIYEKVSERWKNARDWWNKKKGSMSYTPSIGSITDKIKSAWNSAKSWWNKNVRLSIPSLKLKLTYTTDGLGKVTKAAMKALGLPGLPKLSFAANGGIFDQGSLIWAGERGPEVMAKAAGGRTGVMNVQQMQDAVYEGVYAAVVAAMSSFGGNNGSQPVNVYLDGKQITSAVEKRQRERGAALMGNQVYSY